MKAEATTRHHRSRLMGGLLALAVLAAPALHAADLRVLPEEAIPFTAFLKKADFDQRFPGTSVSDPATLDTGWYVSYEHESLHYYFGPILLESTGEDYKAQLEAIVAEAVAQRPSITGYTIDLRYEPSTPREVESPEQDPGRPPQAAPPPPPQRFSLFQLIRRIFGI